MKTTHRELALADPLYFMGYYMGQRCLPHRAAFLDFFLQPETHKLLLAPREHWKTTTLIGYLLWRILKNPDIRILIIAHNQEFATDTVQNIRDHLATHPRIRRDFGDLTTTEWGKEAFTVQRTAKLHEPTCMGAGQGTGILGRHFDIVWCDDIAKTENQWTPEMRQKLWTWFTGTLLRCCDHEMIITGTRKHLEDIYHTVMEQGGYTVQVLRAVLDEDAHTVLAPEIWSYDRLMVEKQRMGELMFRQEMQNEPVPPGGIAFKKEWLRYYDPAKPLPRFVAYYVGIDPAIGQTDVADYTAVVLIGVTTYQQYYVLDMQRQRWPVNWVDRVVGLYKYYCDMLKQRPNVVGVEAIYTGMMQARELQAAATAMPLKFVDYRVRTKDEGIQGQLPRDKIARLQSLGRYFELGRVYLPDPNQHRMTVVFEAEEYLIFPEGEHDDLLDALNIAILVSPYSTQGRSFLYG
jgi:predicted phage terminase large subunit-like protein